MNNKYQPKNFIDSYFFNFLSTIIVLFGIALGSMAILRYKICEHTNDPDNI